MADATPTVPKAETKPTAVSAQEPKPQATIIEESLGSRATKLANIKATQWLEDTWSVIQRKVLDTAQRGLFRCAIRFEDVIPQDTENQQRLLKILERQNLSATFKTLPDSAGVQLDIQWGSHLL